MIPTDIQSLRSLADNGNVNAQYAAGARLLVGRDAPFAPAEGMARLRAAAAQNQHQALSLLAVVAGFGGDWGQARELLQRAARVGSQAALRQLDMVGDLDFADWTSGRRVDWRFEAPRIGVAKSFLPVDFCNWVIEQSRQRLERVRVNDPAAGVSRQSTYRTNSGVGFSVIDSDVVLQLVHARIASTIGIPIRQQEPTNVLHYAIGEEYKLHFDFVDPGVGAYASELQTIGQRSATFLIYLNDDYEGGETHFPRLDWRYKGECGDALLFWNVDRFNQPDKQTLHAGLAPTHGEKWLFSKWIRDRPLPLL